MKEKIVILGSSGHAKVIIEIIQAMGTYEIIGVTTVDPKVKDKFFGYPVLGDDSILPQLKKDGVNLVAIGMGGYTNNSIRKEVYLNAKGLGFNCLTAIHPTAIISPSAKTGECSVIFAGAIVHTDTVIGNNVIIATGSTVDHNTVIADHVLVSAGVSVGANVRIGESSLLAIGSTVITGIKIGAHCLVAAGAVVVKEVLDGQKVFGVPATPK